tara:strand:- start:398 stop:559 length:162 start_codon:yes stop_codon:yes gene_type:complete
MNGAPVVGEEPLCHPGFGFGPKGETFEYALNGSNEKARPETMIALFQKMNNMK